MLSMQEWNEWETIEIIEKRKTGSIQATLPCVWAHPLNCDKLKINLLQHSVKDNPKAQGAHHAPLKKMEIEIDGMEYYKINNRTFKRKTVNKGQCSKSLDICILCIQKYSEFSFFFVHLISIVRSNDSLLVILFVVVVCLLRFFFKACSSRILLSFERYWPILLLAISLL